MAQTRIEIILEVWNTKTQSWKRWYVDTTGGDSIPLTFNINDIKDISITKGSFSKSINLPETANNRQVFSDITDINTFGTFNPGKRQRAFILVDSIMVFDGYFTLTDYVVDDFKNSRQINLNVYAENNDFFSLLGEEFVETLDLAKFNHTYNPTNIVSTWATSSNYTTGYYYPLIDYGNDWNWVGLVTSTLTTTDFKPATYARQIWDQIFVEAGFTWKSGSLTQSTPFDDLVLPFVNGELGMPGNYVAERQFRASISAPQNIEAPALYTNIMPTNQNTPWATWPFNNIIADEVVEFNNDSTPPNGDPNGVWSTTLFEYTNTTAYQISQRFGFSFEIDQSRVWAIDFVPLLQLEIWNGSQWIANQTDASWLNTLYLPVSDISGSGWAYSNAQPWGKPLPFLTFETYKKNFYTPIFSIQPGAKVRIRYKYKLGGNIGLYPILPGEVIATIKNAFVFNEPQTNVVDGMLIDLANTLPKKFKRKDFILSIIKMFNLVIEPDKNIKNQLNIETRNAYYASGPIKDWSRKVDKSKPINTQILAETQDRRLNLKYKDDKDFFNTDYKSKANLTYGEKLYVSDNELLKGSKTLEIAFSPTPLVAVPLQGGNPYGSTASSNLIIPKIGVLNNGQFTKTGCNPRILIKKQKIPCQFYFAFNQQQFTYPYAGHLDDPNNPDIDINFDQTVGVYFQQSTTTANTLYRTYWQSQVEETFDMFSRIVKCHIFLTPEEIWNFRFNWNIFIDFGTGGQYFKVNKIEGWEPGVTKSVLVELIKTKDIQVPKLLPFKKPWSLLTNGVIRNEGADGGSQETARTTGGNSTSYGNDNNYVGDGLLVAGRSNFVSGENSVVSGEGNKVAGSGNNVFGASNSVDTLSSKSFVAGSSNTISNSSNAWILGDRNTIQAGLTQATDNVFIFGSDVVVSTSNAFIVAPPIIQYSNFISAGTDEILGENPDNILINYISAGRDAVKGLGSKSLVNYIDAGQDKII